jgi:hypothetical protein
MLSDDNLHPILFQIEPFPDLLRGVDVPLLINTVTGDVETSENGRPLRYFWHLPRWVAVNVSGALIELWLRLDPRLEMADILDRINAATTRVPRPNAFNMRRIRFRESVNVPAFLTGRQLPSFPDVAHTLTREQILLNTSMVVDLPNGRLLKPVLAHHRTQGYVDSGLPLDCFVRGFPTPIPIPSDRQVVVLELRKRLQTLSRRRGYGSGAIDFSRLPPNLQPSWWHARNTAVQAEKIADIDGKTHDEFVRDLLRQYPGLMRTGVTRTPRAARTAAAPAPPAQQPGPLLFTPATAAPASAQRPPPPLPFTPATTAPVQRPRPLAPTTTTAHPRLLAPRTIAPGPAAQPRPLLPAPTTTAPAVTTPAAATPNPPAIDPRLLAASVAVVFGREGLLGPDELAEDDPSNHVTTPDGATHYYVEPVHRAMYGVAGEAGVMATSDGDDGGVPVEEEEED